MTPRGHCPVCHSRLGTSLTSCACGWKMLDPMPCIDYRAAMKQNAMAAQQWFSEYERAAAETDTLRARIAELEAELAAARDKALEDAAQCCEREADRCDDAAIWGGSRTHVNNCKAAAYAMRDRANAIRAMKGEGGK